MVLLGLLGGLGLICNKLSLADWFNILGPGKPLLGLFAEFAELWLLSLLSFIFCWAAAINAVAAAAGSELLAICLCKAEKSIP